MRRYSRVRVDRLCHYETNHRSSAPASARLSDFRCLAFARGESLLPSRQVPRRSRPRKKYIDGRRQCALCVGSFSFFLFARTLPSSRLMCATLRAPRTVIQRYQQIAKSQRQTAGKCAKRDSLPARYATKLESDQSVFYARVSYFFVTLPEFGQN